MRLVRNIMEWVRRTNNESKKLTTIILNPTIKPGPLWTPVWSNDGFNDIPTVLSKPRALINSTKKVM